MEGTIRASLGKPHAAQQRLVSGVGVEILESRFASDINQRAIPFGVRLVEQAKGRVLISQSAVGRG